MTICGFLFASNTSSFAAPAGFNPYPGTSLSATNTTLNATDASTILVSGLSVADTVTPLEVPVQLSVTSGSLSMSQRSGLTFYPAGVTTGSTISFKGTPGDVNAALATLSVTKAGVDNITLTAKLWDPSRDFTCSTGHLYRVVNSQVTYSAANAAANAEFENTGYLVHPSTADENTCVYNGITSIAGSANITWIGISSRYVSTDVIYSWDGGPVGEANVDIWKKSAGTTGTHGTSISGNFANWDLQGTIYQPNARWISNAIEEPLVVYYSTANNPTWHDVKDELQGNGKYVIEADQPQISSTTVALNFLTSTPTPSASPTSSSTPVTVASTALATTAGTPIRDALLPVALVLFGISLVAFSVYQQRKSARRQNG